MNYTNIPIGTSNPGCVIFLVDQSWSMNEDWESGKKAERAVIMVSEAIHNLGLKCQHGTETRKRCYVAIISYGDSVNCITKGMIDEVFDSPIEVKKVKKPIPDGAGGIVEVETEVPIWMKPKANGVTPMHEAFDRAGTMITKWISNWQDCFPPVVINITDGEPTNPSLTGDSARALMNMSTSDGNVLLYNLHISEPSSDCVFPHDQSLLPDNPFAEFLFSISSLLPESLFSMAKEHGFSPQPAARCFAYNAGEDLTTRLIEFGSPGTNLPVKV